MDQYPNENEIYFANVINAEAAEIKKPTLKKRVGKLL